MNISMVYQNEVFFFSYLFFSIIWIILKNGCLYKILILLIILILIFIRSRISRYLWCDILLKAFSQFRNIFAPPESKLCIIYKLINNICNIFFYKMLVIILYDEFSKEIGR